MLYSDSFEAYPLKSAVSMCSSHVVCSKLIDTSKTCIAFVKVRALVDVSCVSCSVVKVEVTSSRF